jgi:glyoxylase-like metal-dependent hydrolase (beta-lactamase superfamily II)
MGARAAPAVKKILRITPPGAQVVLQHGDARVGTYVSESWGFSTNSYWIDGPEGLVIVDTQFLPSATEELLQWAESTTGKKVALAVVLHANPDKFNGTHLLRARGIKVVTSKQVRDLIPSVHEKRLKAFYERYQPDYPREVPLPDAFGGQSMELSAAGVTFTAHVLGAGCSKAHVVLEYDGHVFVGDLIANGSHSWLEIGKTDEWLKRLEEIRAMKPDFVHPGRGPSGDARLLEQQEHYLRKVVEMVAEEQPRMPVDKGAVARIKERLERFFVGYRFGVFLDIGLPAEWRRQAAGAASSPAAPR